jgi:hypothetical protein
MPFPLRSRHAAAGLGEKPIFADNSNEIWFKRGHHVAASPSDAAERMRHNAAIGKP